MTRFAARRPLSVMQSAIPWPRLAVLAVAACLFTLTVPARADTLTGVITKVDGAGKSIEVGGNSISISSSRTNICIKGVCDQPASKLAVGLTCRVETRQHDGKTEAVKLSCK
jgi:hypothetical protein